MSSPTFRAPKRSPEPDYGPIGGLLCALLALIVLLIV
jgi:hypothetical protein